MEMRLVNYMEIAVDHYIKNLLKAFPDVCKCDHCMMDIKALTLNQLKPHYIVTERGELYSKIEEMNLQFETDVLKALVDSISKVSKSPRHNENSDFSSGLDMKRKGD